MNLFFNKWPYDDVVIYNFSFFYSIYVVIWIQRNFTSPYMPITPLNLYPRRFKTCALYRKEKIWYLAQDVATGIIFDFVYYNSHPYFRKIIFFTFKTEITTRCLIYYFPVFPLSCNMEENLSIRLVSCIYNLRKSSLYPDLSRKIFHLLLPPVQRI